MFREDGMIHSVAKWRTAAGPVATALAARTALNVSMTTTSAKADVGDDDPCCCGVLSFSEAALLR